MERYKNTMIPLGSIVELKSGNKTMIIGYGLEDKESKKDLIILAVILLWGLWEVLNFLNLKM